MHFLRRPEHLAAQFAQRLALPALTLAAALAFLPSLHAQTLPAPPETPAPPPATLPTQSPAQSPTQSPDQDADGLPSLHALPSTLNTTQLDGATLTQSFAAVPAGSGADPAPDAADDSDSAELTTGPTHGLARGRHAGAAYLFAPSSIREFRVTGQQYSAATPSAGALTFAATQAGTPRFHGSAFFTLRSSLFAATDPDAIANTFTNGIAASTPVKPHDLRERFGGTLAGPIPLGPITAGPILSRQALTFFYAFDAQRRGFPAISSPADPNFFALTPTQRALLGNRGVTSTQTTAALNYLASLTGTVPRRADQTIHFARIDWLQHPRLPLALQYNRVRYTAPAGLIDAPVIPRARASLGTASGSVDSVFLRAEFALTPRLLNETHIAYLRDLQYELPQPPLPQEPAIGPAGLAPEVNIAPNGFLFGTPATLTAAPIPDERRLELADTLTYTRGRSLLALGGSIAFLHDRAASLTNSAGTFFYDSGTTNGRAGGLVDFLSDYTYNIDTVPNGPCPSIFAATHLFCFQTFTQSFGPQRAAFSTQDDSAFVQQTLRLRPRFTLAFGVRYEYTLLPIPTAPNPTLDSLFAARGSTSIFPEDRNNFAPRASVAWQPRRLGFTFHAGYGLFYARLPGAALRNALTDTALPSSTTRIRITPATTAPCGASPTQSFGYPCSFLTRPTGVPAQTTSAVVFDRRFRLPAIQQASFTLQRELPRHTFISAGYLLNLDRQLPGSTDLNIAPSTQTAQFQLQGAPGAPAVPGLTDGETFLLPLYTARLTPLFGPVTELTSHSNGTYNALLLSAQTQPSRTLLASAGYTWSKALDDAPNLTATPRTSTQLDPYTNGYDKGLSSLNQSWSLFAQAQWSPIFHARSPTLERLANGFRFTPIVAAHAGRPYSYDLSGGPALAGGHQSLNGSGGALYLPTVGRNTLRLPRTATVDLRATRAFAPIRRLHLQALAEAYNLLNTHNLSAVNQRAYLRGTPVAGITPLVFQSAAAIAAEGLNTTPFGTPTAASTALARARQLQFELRIAF